MPRLDESMQYEPVSSSNVHSIAYDPVRQLLFVKFHKDGAVTSTYVYQGVPEWIYNEFREAGSKGKFLARYVKGTFEYLQIIS